MTRNENTTHDYESKVGKYMLVVNKLPTGEYAWKVYRRYAHNHALKNNGLEPTRRKAIRKAREDVESRRG
jgi:hypothetical protein